MKQQISRLLSRYGYQISRPLSRTAKLLHYYNVDCVIDVGANDGGFALAIRRQGYTGQIVSFEPILDTYVKLEKKSARDDTWTACRYALGNTRGEITINISANGAASSSILPMLDACTDAAPMAHYIGEEIVPLERLEDLLPSLRIKPASRIFLKIDAQGYEGPILDGAARLFENGAIIGMQLELSLVPLYAGAITYDEGLARAARLGMTLMRLDPEFDDPRTGQALQVDAVFFA